MEKYDIILEAGQSNAAGYGHGPAKHPYIPDARILYLTDADPMTEDYAPAYNMDIAGERPNPAFGPEDRLGDLALSFAESYVKEGLLAPDRKLLIVRSAVGATGFLKHHWGMGEPLYLRMLRMTDRALSLHPENRLVAFLWHQGETDALLGAGQEEHYQNLQTLLKSVRTNFQVPELPFIAGDFVHHWRDDNKEICEPVLNAIREVCKGCGYGDFVETDGLQSNAQSGTYFGKIIFPYFLKSLTII